MPPNLETFHHQRRHRELQAGRRTDINPDSASISPGWAEPLRLPKPAMDPLHRLSVINGMLLSMTDFGPSSSYRSGKPVLRKSSSSIYLGCLKPMMHASSHTFEPCFCGVERGPTPMSIHRLSLRRPQDLDGFHCLNISLHQIVCHSFAQSFAQDYQGIIQLAKSSFICLHTALHSFNLPHPALISSTWMQQLTSPMPRRL